MMPKGHLAESEAKGYADGITGVMKSRSLDPDEKRYLSHYEPDDEAWNSYQYGQGNGYSEFLKKEYVKRIGIAISNTCINSTAGQMLGDTRVQK